jgi:hypothetical protein
LIELEKAFIDYDNALSGTGNASYINKRGYVHALLKNYDNAIADYTKALD